jgi:hypothetical protein
VIRLKAWFERFWCDVRSLSIFAVEITIGIAFFMAYVTLAFLVPMAIVAAAGYFAFQQHEWLLIPGMVFAAIIVISVIRASGWTKYYPNME